MVWQIEFVLANTSVGTTIDKRQFQMELNSTSEILGDDD